MHNYFVMIEHIGGNKGVLAVDVVSRKAVRNMEVFSEKHPFALGWNRKRA